MKKYLFAISILTSFYLNAQNGSVGINTESPKATLHVLGSPTDTSKLDGISIVNLLVWTEFHKCRRDFA